MRFVCFLVLVGLISSCGCSEDKVESEEIPECEDSMEGLDWPDSDEACQQCCEGVGYEEGMPFGTVANAINARCECGNHMVCDNE